MKGYHVHYIHQPKGKEAEDWVNANIAVVASSFDEAEATAKEESAKLYPHDNIVIIQTTMQTTEE